MHHRTLTAFGVVSLAVALWTGIAQVHDGHDLGAPAPPISKTIAPRGKTASDALELTAIPRNGTVTFYLDRFRTNEPVEGAVVEVETPEGPRTAAQTVPGAYVLPASWIFESSVHELLVTVTAGEVVDVLTVSVPAPDAEPSVPATPPGAPSAMAGVSEALVGLRNLLATVDPVLILASSGAFLLGMLLSSAMRGRRGLPAVAVAVIVVSATLLLGGTAFAHGDEDHGASVPGSAPLARERHSPDLAQRLADGSVFVPKPTQRLMVLRTTMTERATFHRTVEMPGRVIPDPNASGVVQSSVGGRLSPPTSGSFPRLGTSVRRGDVLALVTPPVQAVDASDMRQRQGELDQQVDIVRRRVDRLRKLTTTGAVAQIQLDDAGAELKGLQDRRAALDRMRQQSEALVAPVDGMIAQGSAVAGQMATAGAMVFQIIDPRRLWVEALSFDALTPTGNATARFADGRTLTLTHQGAGLADRNQAIPVQFAVEGDTMGLRVGQFLTVLAGTDAEQSGLALPRAAVVRSGNGQAIVYEHVAAERFEARQVRVEPLDGTNVLVSDGVGAGKRIVIQGAELLDQVR